jgi:spore cortex biosynthesis protein YabQ
MNKAITIEMQFFLVSILWGSILLLVYDVLRILRRIIKHNSFFLAFEDLIFWVVSSVFIFAMMYKENNGIIRGFSVMGMAIGMVLYHYILSEFVVNLITKLIQALFRPFTFVFKKINKLFHFMGSKFKKLFGTLFFGLKKIMKSYKIRLGNKRQKQLQKREVKREKKAKEKLARKKEAKEKKLQDQKKKDLNPRKTAQEIPKKKQDLSKASDRKPSHNNLQKIDRKFKIM